MDWDNPDGIKCAKETYPIFNLTTRLDVGTDRRVFAVAVNVTQSMKVPVYFVNITSLSELRKDAHTSVHTIRQGKLLTPEQQADPMNFADCIHWCLPGLPDMWNEFLYSRIISHSWQWRTLNFFFSIFLINFCNFFFLMWGPWGWTDLIFFFPFEFWGSAYWRGEIWQSLKMKAREWECNGNGNGVHVKKL